MQKRRMLKVAVWRCISISVTLVVLFIATGDVKSASSITLFLHALLLAGHYTFEILWDHLDEDRL